MSRNEVSAAAGLAGILVLVGMGVTLWRLDMNPNTIVGEGIGVVLFMVAAVAMALHAGRQR